MISHRHQVIFVHVPKTGGQSIEQMFLDDLGLTWRERGELLLKVNEDPARGPGRLAHLYADEYVSLGHISQQEFDRYFKFAVVRDPLSRAVSEFLYRFRADPFWRRPSPEAFLSERFETDFSDAARHLTPQSRYVFDQDGRPLVDQVIRLEALSESAPLLTREIFGEERAVPHRNRAASRAAIRKKRVKARIAAKVADMYRSDYEAFGYPSP